MFNGEYDFHQCGTVGVQQIIQLETEFSPFSGLRG
jgi:hypothetical protein